MAWSHSALEQFNTCPKQYYHTKIKKDVKEVFGADADYGSKAHKFFEDYLKGIGELPLDLVQHRKMLDKMRDAPGKGYGEQKLALTKEYAPTGFFDRDVWGRAIVDYMKVNGSKVVIADWKFGKMKDDFQQLNIFIAFIAAYMPEVDTFTAAFYWAKEKQFTQIKRTRAEVPEIWNGIIPRVQKLEVATKTLDFPARPSGLCKKYCPVTSCPNNGGFL